MTDPKNTIDLGQSLNKLNFNMFSVQITAVPTQDKNADKGARLHLMLDIQHQLADRGLTKDGAAEACGLSEKRMRDFLNNKINKFTLDDLVAINNRLVAIARSN